MVPAPGAPLATVLTRTGPRAQTGATDLGPRGGVAAHAHLQTGLAGQPDPGRRMRRGRRGRAARSARLLRALLPGRSTVL